MKYLAVFILYFGLAYFSKLFALPYDLSSLFFPAAGMAIAALLSYGLRALIPIYFGACAFVFSQIYSDFDIATLSSYHFLISAGLASFQAYVGYLLTRKYLQTPNGLIRTTDGIKFVLYPSLLTPLIGSALFFLTYPVEGYFDTRSFISIGVVWYIGDAIGTAFGLITFLALFGKFDTRFNSRKIQIITSSFMILLFVSFYFKTTLRLEEQKEFDKLKVQSNELFYRIETELHAISSRIRDLRNLIYSSSNVEKNEFNIFLSSIFQDHSGIEYILWTTSDKNFPVLYSLPQGISEGKSDLQSLGILSFARASIVNSDYELFVKKEDKNFFYLSLPVFKITPGRRVRTLEGILVVKINTKDFIDNAYKDFYTLGHSLVVSFNQNSESHILYDSSVPQDNYKRVTLFKNSKKIRLFNKRIRYDFSVDDSFVLKKVDLTYIITGIVGLFFTLLSMIASLVHSGRNLIIYEKVKKETKDLEDEFKKIIKEKKIESEFLVTTAHQLKTISSGQIGIIDNLEEDKSLTKHFKYFELLRQSASEINVSASDLLDITNLETEKIKIDRSPFSFTSLVQEIETIYTQKVTAKKIDFEVFKDETIPEFVVSDRARLKQVITSLLENSLKNTQKGKIQIYFTSIFKEKNYQLNIRIIDTGKRLVSSEKDSSYVNLRDLAKNEEEKFRSNGLLLSICYRVAKALDGSISYKRDFEEEGHSHYLFEVPVEAYMNQSGYGRAIKESQKMPLKLRTKKALLVEDNEVNQLICARFLDKLGLRYDLVENGKKATEKVKENEYDIILMDCMMPVMDGFEATKIIRKTLGHSDILIIGMSTAQREDEEKKCLDVGMSAYIEKPIQFSDIVSILSAHFRD